MGDNETMNLAADDDVPIWMDSPCCNNEEGGQPRRHADNCYRCEINENRETVAALLVGIRAALGVLSTKEGATEDFRYAVAHVLWGTLSNQGYPLPPIPGHAGE